MIQFLKMFRSIGGVLTGVLDYHRHPHKKESWEGGFNDQKGRQQIFKEVVQAIPFDLIIETGTFRGETTEFMYRQTNLPIYTVETGSRLFGYSWAKLRRYREVCVCRGDSRVFLKNLLSKSEIKERNLFFYLDAHWERDVPLKEEVEQILSLSHHSVIMIDDFEVPGDSGYRFDDYGQDKKLNLSYLQLEKFSQVEVYFPALTSNEETGAKRGCVLICNHPHWTEKLNRISLLRRSS